MTENKPSKTWAFTINNYEYPTDVDCVRAWLPECTRVVLSREIGEQGTPHLQGAITFRIAKRLSALKKLHSRAHWEAARSGDPFTYCLKSDSNVEINHDVREQGKRTDIEKVAKELLEKPQHIVAKENPAVWVKHRNGLLQWARDVRPPVVVGTTKVYWLYGKGGSGKGKWMREMSERKGDKCEVMKFDYFRGYMNQTSVLLHDLRPSSMDWEYLLNLLDKWAVFDVPTFYGTAKWPPQYIFISSPLSVEDFCKMKTSEEMYQLQRRIDVTINYMKHIEEKDGPIILPDITKIL